MSETSKDPKVLLAEAIRKRDELNTFIKIMQELIGIGGDAITQDSNGSKPIQTTPTGDIEDPMSVVYPGLFFGKSQPQAVRLLLERVRRPLRVKVILECLAKGGLSVGGKKPTINLWGVLNRSEEFVPVPKAGWALSDWYDASVLAKMREG